MGEAFGGGIAERLRRSGAGEYVAAAQRWLFSCRKERRFRELSGLSISPKESPRFCIPDFGAGALSLTRSKDPLVEVF